MGGFFLLSFRLATFDKSPISVAAQLLKLESRGLLIPNRDAAHSILSDIGYYRFSGYALHFQFNHQYSKSRFFIRDTNFEDVIARYELDKHLRMVVLAGVERVETALKALTSDMLALRHGTHWYQNREIFIDRFDFDAYCADIRRKVGADAQAHKRTTYIKHYFSTYDVPEMPPCWMVMEAISFGTFSLLFSKIKQPELTEICQHFSLPYAVLSSWLHSMSYVRNICAHHARLWNRTCTITPIIPRRDDKFPQNNSSLYAQMYAIQRLNRRIVGGLPWSRKIIPLAQTHPTELKEMGFPETWLNLPVWS